MYGFMHASERRLIKHHRYNVYTKLSITADFHADEEYTRR